MVSRPVTQIRAPQVMTKLWAPLKQVMEIKQRSSSELAVDEAEGNDHEFGCSFCPAVLTNKFDWKRHQRRKHLAVVNDTLGNCKNCRFLLFVFPLSDIVAVRRESGQFRCPILQCRSVTFLHIDTLSRHMDQQHNENAYVGEYENNANDKAKRLKLQSPLFDMRIGSHLALGSSSETLAHHQPMSIGCSLLALHLEHHDMPKTHTAHTLIRNDMVLDLMENVPFDDGDYSKQLQCVLQVHNESMKAADQFTKPTSISNSYMSKLISSSRLSGLLDAIEFALPSTQLLDALNIDFRMCPALLHAVAVLHTGCRIVNRNNTLLRLTVEAYSRAKLLDVHGESNMKSIPLPGSQYNGLSVGIHEESDGRPAKMKLKIGSKTMNVLITMSTMISKNDVFIGSETPLSIEQAYATICNYKCPLSVSSLRQLTSSFKHRSTYSKWRATLDCLDNDRLQPVTTFTIADVPNIQGYGVSDASMAKITSLVLQTIAIAVMTERPLENKDIEKIIRSREDAVSHALLARHDLDPINIAPFLSPFVKSAASFLSTANQKIKTNVEAKLQTLFGNQN